MMIGAGIESRQKLASLVPVELRAALLKWYPFSSGARALYLGGDEQAHVPSLEEHFSVVDLAPEQDCQYDCIFIHDLRGSEKELRSELEELSGLLAPDGVLLLGFRNRLGLKYLVGSVDDAVSEPFSSIRPVGDGTCGLLSRGQVEAALLASRFALMRFYAVMPDECFAQVVCSDEYVHKAGVRDRVLPYDPYGSPVLVPESDLYDILVHEQLLPRLANFYVVECKLQARQDAGREVQFVALSADRGEENSFATVIYGDGTVLKRNIYARGYPALVNLFENCEALRRTGVRVVDQKLGELGIEMPFIEEEPLLCHLDKQLHCGKEAFLEVFEILRADWMKSSRTVDLDDSEAHELWDAGADALGPVLEHGFIDMIPYNAFWSDGTIVYYDQEFLVPRCPVAYIMFRALRYTYIHLPWVQDVITLQEAQEALGLSQLWDAFMDRENAFVGENRNWNRYRKIYEWADFNREQCEQRVERAIAALESEDADVIENAEPAGEKRYGTGLLMGVFDLFHIGHLRLIKRAKAHCKKLRVGVLSDELVMEYKQKLPVIPLSERMEIIEAIKDVDEVVEIADNPSRLQEWHRRPFDCFFSGNDYEGDPYWEWERSELRKLGSDIQFFPYTEEQSSSKIRSHLK